MVTYKNDSSALSLTPVLDGFGWLRPRFTPKNEPVAIVKGDGSVPGPV
jgi:hypothetical protein